jgi:anti-sigma regulatory factor (Ser/Thr protein kinase)
MNKAELERAVRSKKRCRVISRLPARPQSAALARLKVRDVLGPDVAEAFAYDCELVVSELVANAAEHATAAVDDSVELALELIADGLVVTVTDSGGGLRFRPVQREARGLGLQIVSALARDYTIASTPAGTTIHVLVPRTDI